MIRLIFIVPSLRVIVYRVSLGRRVQKHILKNRMITEKPQVLVQELLFHHFFSQAMSRIAQNP